MKPSIIIAFVAVLAAIGIGSYYLSNNSNTAPSNTTEVARVERGTPPPADTTTDETVEVAVETPTEFFPTVEDKSGSAAQPIANQNNNTVPKSESALPKTHSVLIENFAYGPKTITIKRGDRVTFTNRDSMGHTATADDGSFDTGMIEQGQSKTITFAHPGSYSYHCTPHPNMKATIIVQ